MPLLFTDACWPVFLEGLRQLFVELDPVGCLKKLDYYAPCALDAVSKAASLGIVAGAALLKVPQILNVLAAKSAEGLSVLSLELDVLVFKPFCGEREERDYSCDHFKVAYVGFPHFDLVKEGNHTRRHCAVAMPSTEYWVEANKAQMAMRGLRGSALLPGCVREDNHLIASWGQSW